MHSKRLKIAVLARAYPTVSETFIRDQIHDLRDAGHSLDVYSLYIGPTPGEPPDRETAETQYLIGPQLPLGRAVLRASRRLLQGLSSPTALLSIGRSALRHPREAAEAVHALPILRGNLARYDVIHAHFGLTGLLAVLLRRAGLIEGPLVTTFHGIDLTRHPTISGQDIYSELFRSGELFTVGSSFTEQLIVRLGAPIRRVRRVPVGVNLARIAFQPRSWSGGELRLLTVARLEAVKGLRYGIEAAALLVKEGIDVRYTVVGGGQLADRLRADAARLGLSARVRFTGPMPLEAVLREYYRHHLFVLPGVITADQQVEGQGRVLVEAQASGMPIVASRVGGIPETVASGAGYLVEPGDATLLAARIRSLLDEYESWAEMGERGRNHVVENYDQQVLLERLLGVYQEAARHSARGNRD